MRPIPPRRPNRRENNLRVLIVAAAANVVATVQAALQLAGMTTELAATGVEALERKAEFIPEIMLIDLDLPDIAGLDLVAGLAQLRDCGIIVITAEAARAMAAGANDTVAKPLAARALVARVRALHRRLQRPAGPHPATITIDHTRRLLLSVTGVPTTLSEAEHAALATLLEAEGTSVSREWLGRIALKRQTHAEDRSIDQLILELRRKLNGHGASPRTILSSRGQGYVIADPAAFTTVSEP